MPDLEETDDLALGFALAMDEEPEKKEPEAEPEKKEPEAAEPEKTAAEPEPEKTEPVVKVEESAKPDPAVTVLQAEIKKLQESNAKLEESLKKPETPAEPTAEEKAEQERVEGLLAGVRKDWPDVAETFQILLDRQKKLLEASFEKQLKESQAAVTQQFEPIAKTAQQIEYDKFIAPIAEKHPDHKEICLATEGQQSKLRAWMATLPAHIQIGCEHVMEKGTPQQVVQLLDDYKKANGGAAPDPEAEKKKQEAEAARLKEEEEKKKKLEKMEGVRSTPSNRADSLTDPDDFAGGFLESLKQTGT